MWKITFIVLAILLLTIILVGPKTSDILKPPEISAPIQFHPNSVAIQFRYGSLAEMIFEGAVVCSDLNHVEEVIGLYTAHYEDTLQDLITHGQSVLQRGPGTPIPDMAFYGCSLLPKGTPVQIHQGFGGGYQITAYLPDGTLIHGVTRIGMLASSEKH